MKKYKSLDIMRSPRTTQEKRENGRRSKWARAKRNASNLPDSWDDNLAREEKTWKNKRKKQYYPGGRGKKHVIVLKTPHYSHKNWQRLWNVVKWLKNKEIPHRIRRLNNCPSKTVEITWWGDRFPHDMLIGLEYEKG